VDIPETNVFV